jgi:hypothetical protein
MCLGGGRARLLPGCYVGRVVDALLAFQHLMGDPAAFAGMHSKQQVGSRHCGRQGAALPAEPHRSVGRRRDLHIDCTRRPEPGRMHALHGNLPSTDSASESACHDTDTARLGRRTKGRNRRYGTFAWDAASYRPATSTSSRAVLSSPGGGCTSNIRHPILARVLRSSECPRAWAVLVQIVSTHALRTA